MLGLTAWSIYAAACFTIRQENVNMGSTVRKVKCKHGSTVRKVKCK